LARRSDGTDTTPRAVAERRRAAGLVAEHKDSVFFSAAAVAAAW